MIPQRLLYNIDISVRVSRERMVCRKLIVASLDYMDVSDHTRRATDHGAHRYTLALG